MRSALIIGCGKTKIWQRQPSLGPVPAREAYIGPLFRASRNYADKFYKGHWIIVSAKYGLLHPNSLITDYDVTLGGRTNSTTLHQDLTTQWGKMLSHYEVIISFAGQAYNRYLTQVVGKGQLFEVPLASLSLFERMKWLKDATSAAKKPWPSPSR